MGSVRSRRRYGVWILALGVIALGCGRTANKGGDQPFGPGAGGASATAARDPDAPNCAVSIVGTDARHCAVYQDGSVWCWGASLAGPRDSVVWNELKRLDIDGHVVKVAMGPSHDCALDSDGGLTCWGDNVNGEIDDSGQTPLPPTPVAAGPLNGPIQGLGLGPAQTCVVDTFAHVYCRGSDASGHSSGPRQIDVAGDTRDTRDTRDTTISGITPEVFDERGRIFGLSNWDAPEPLLFYGEDNAWLGGSTPACVLKRTGSLWCTDYLFGTDDGLRVKKQLGESVVQAGAGDLFMCALTADGKVWCEGFNKVGQTGRGDYTDFAGGAFVPNLSDMRALSVNQYSACALKSDGSVWCWGAYRADGTDQQTSVPTRVSSCVKQEIAPPAPGPLSITPVDTTTRLAEAGRARGQALCQCASAAEAEESCISAEDFAPNAACLAALAPDEVEHWRCRADALWRETACFVGCARNGSDLPNCGPDAACNDPELPGIEYYCRRVTCAGDQEQSLTKYQICDGKVDCNDGSDERNCLRGARFFECASDAKAIALTQVCNAVPDCDDGSDEQYCP